MNRSVGVDVSDGPFDVTVLGLTDPNGGEILSSGDVHMIRWETHGTAAPVAAVRLFLSMDAGASWTRIVKIRGSNSGSYEWQVPTVAAVELRCKIKVVLTDGSDGRLGKDESDALFTIRPPSEGACRMNLKKEDLASKALVLGFEPDASAVETADR